MSNPSTVSLQLGAAVSNGIAQSQQPLAAGNLTLNGSLVSGGVAIMDVARRVSIASSGADGSVVFTVFGTDRSGNVQSETVTGVATPTAVATLGDYKTVTRVAVSGATAGNITVGTNGVGSSIWVVDDFLKIFWRLSGGITGPAGTTYTLEHTYTDPNNTVGSGVIGAEQWSMSAGGAVPPHVYVYAGINAASGDNQFDYPGVIFAHRLTINSGTGLVTMDSIQAGIRS